VKANLAAMLPPRVEAVDEFCLSFRDWLGARVSSRSAFAAELLLREALANAINHGGQNGRLAPVKCRVRERGRLLWIGVADSGPGFDWKRQMHEDVADDALHGRGLMIYQNYAHRVRFNRAGNAVVLVLELERNA
jgi:serine/threonine-protein kinase RsbW